MEKKKEREVGRERERANDDQEKNCNIRSNRRSKSIRSSRNSRRGGKGGERLGGESGKEASGKEASRKEAERGGQHNHQPVAS